MGALMRAELERQGIDMPETVQRHVGIVAAVSDGDLPRLRAELRAHYLGGFPVLDDAPWNDGQQAAEDDGHQAG